MSTQEIKSIVFDLDDTLCFPNHEYSDSVQKYQFAAPNQPVIDKLNKYFENGYRITILTARRMVTHNGDIAKIKQDVGAITENWLHEHGVHYHECMFGKPFSGSYYVDDKALRPDEFLSTDII